MYFDSHAHYNDGRYDDDRHELLLRLNNECSVDYIMNISYDMPSSEQTVILADKYDSDCIKEIAEQGVITVAACSGMMLAKK